MLSRWSEAQPPEEPAPDRHARRRLAMVGEQLERRGIHDPRVLRAMETVPREEFTLPEFREEAYEDGPLPIGLGQTISQPYTVAYMAEAACLRGSERVLEIGTGSGYGAAVLSLLAAEVFTIERLAPLAVQARERLARLGYRNVTVLEGDGVAGWPSGAPYEAILVTAGAETLPPAYPEQLAEGGRLLSPLGPGPQRQRMLRYTRRAGRLTAEDLGGFAFVPLVGAAGWAP